MLAANALRSALVRTAAVGPCACSRRNFNLHEYQSKSILREHGVAVEDFFVAKTPTECKQQLGHFPHSEYVVKAQILAGGRGKGTFTSGLKGGVQLTDDRGKVLEYAGGMLGQQLVTKQTPSTGLLVDTIMVSEKLRIAREMYLVIVLSRADTAPMIIASAAGGVNVEATAAQDPDMMHQEVVDVAGGLQPAQVARLTAALGFEPETAACRAAEQQIHKLYDAFNNVDATQIEINPLVETSDGKVLCVDAKVSYDDAARFRRSDIFDMQDAAAIYPAELAAQKLAMKYIKLDGDIACLVNGAGLAMAVMDMIKLHGGEPANFMDVGGRVNAERLMEAVRIVVREPSVEAILVNIFGGIVNCSLIAQGLVSAFSESPPPVPLVVRLEGTEATKARRMLDDAHLPMLFGADNLDEAAKVAIVASRVYKMSAGR